MAGLRLVDRGWGGPQSLQFAPELIVLLFGVVQAAGIFDGHLVTFLRLVDAIAWLKDLASDSHGDLRGLVETSFVGYPEQMYGRLR